MVSRTRVRSRTPIRLCIALTSLLIISVLTAPPIQAAVSPVLTPGPTVASADGLPTVQIDGVVWQQAIVGNTVYAGGNFANARPAGSAPGSNQVARRNLVAYNISNGVMTSFAPNPDGQVRAVAASPDGSRIYIGGEFRNVVGAARSRIAAYSTATGQLIAGFDASVDYTVRAIAATNSTVYVGGSFSNSRGVTRTRLAAFDAGTGALLGWNPSADGHVNAMVLAPDNSKLMIGGAFQKVNGANAYGLAAINPTTGALMAWNTGNVVRDAGEKAAILSLTTNGNSVYGSGYVFSGTGGNLEGAFKAEIGTGNIQWIEDCHGDTYDVAVANDVVYTVSHAHYCGNIGGMPNSDPRSTNMRHAIAFTNAATGLVKHNTESGPYTDWFGYQSPSIYHWFPDVKTGTFTGQTQSAWDVTANADYVVMGGEFPSVNNVAQQGLVRFARRDISPTNQGPRLAGANFLPSMVGLGSGTVRVGWTANWDRDDMNLTYRLIRDNNQAAPIASIAGSSTFWNLPSMGFIDNVTPGSTHTYRIQAVDPDGNSALGSEVSFQAPSGAQSGYAQRVIADGAAPYWRLSESSGTAALDHAGFNDGIAGTGLTRGAAGAIVNDPNTASGFGGSTASTVVTRQPVTAPNTFTLETWFKTTTGSGGKLIGFGNNPTANSGSFDRHLYMDNTGRIFFGTNPGALRTVNSTTRYNDGLWHHAVGTLGSSGMSLYVDGVRVGNRTDTTSGQAINGYWKVGGDNMGTWPSRPTSNYFSGTLDDVAIYPTALSAATVAAHYNLSGRGSSGPPANEAPVALFSSSLAGRVLSVNGSGSSDPDGSVASHSWNWGDNTAAGSGASASHTYAADGTYTVVLTVTDNDGATATRSSVVTVGTPPAAGVSDAFGRTVSNGWGSADEGGPWTLTGGPDKFSVSGGTGRVLVAVPGAGPTATLNESTIQDVDGTIDVSVDKAATGTGIYATMQTRRVGTSSYQFSLKFLSNNTATVGIARTVSGASTSLGTVTVPGLAYSPGDVLRLRFQAIGSGTTNLAVKAWEVGTPEPGSFQVAVADSTAALQVAGAFSLQAYVSSGATNTPLTATFDNLDLSGA